MSQKFIDRRISERRPYLYALYSIADKFKQLLPTLICLQVACNVGAKHSLRIHIFVRKLTKLSI